MTMNERSPNAVLVGGSVEIRDIERLRQVDTIDDEVKIYTGNHYEKLTAPDEAADIGNLALRVFGWTDFTHTAE
jgi:hypothetical protein